MTFIFEKRGSGNWWHYQGTIKEMAAPNIIPVFEAVSQTVSLQFPNGSNFPKNTIPIADIRVKNGVSGVLELFTTVAQLRDRLVALGYPSLISGGAITVPNLADVLLVGGREAIVIEYLSYNLITANKTQIINFTGDSTSDVNIAIQNSQFANGDAIIGKNLTGTFDLIIDNTDGLIVPSAETSFVVPPLYTFILTKVDSSTYTLELTSHNISGSGGGSYNETTLAELMQSFTEETTIDDDDDLINFTDVSQTKQKIINLANFRVKLKAFFDTLYTNTSAVATQISTALANKKVNAMVVCQHSIQNFADNTSYFFGVLNAVPATATFATRRFNAPLTGKIIAVHVQTNAGTPTSAQDVSLRINNKTTAVNNTVGNIRYDNNAYAFSFTGLSITVDINNNLECEVQVPSLTTNGTQCATVCQIIFEAD